jgi:hypothetical protein
VAYQYHLFDMLLSDGVLIVVVVVIAETDVDVDVVVDVI